MAYARRFLSIWKRLEKNLHNINKLVLILVVMKKSVRLYINGTVQGVFFRAFIKEEAEKLNLKGFVRNLEDGRIEVFLEGGVDEVQKMIDICKKGPKHSMIREVEVKPEAYQDFKEFKVLRV